MASKIRVKVGDLEVEFEGTEEFLRDELPPLLEFLSNLDVKNVTVSDDGDSNAPQVNTKLGTTNTVAAKLGSKTGPDLIVAAAAKLHVGDGKGTFTRRELLTEMQGASNYFKATYTNNLTTYLSGLVKSGALLEQAKDTYALSSTKAGELKALLDK